LPEINYTLGKKNFIQFFNLKFKSGMYLIYKDIWYNKIDICTLKFNFCYMLRVAIAQKLKIHIGFIFKVCNVSESTTDFLWN
jgi:hypothetical protein